MKYLDVHMLYQYNHVEGKTLTEIAEIIGESRAYVNYRVKRLNFPVIKHGGQNRIKLDINQIIDLYVNQNLTAKQIGERFFVSGSTILNRLKEHNIEVRPKCHHHR